MVKMQLLIKLQKCS